MYRFLKVRWLLRQVRKDCFNGVRDGLLATIITGETWMKRHTFVDFNGENIHFLWWRLGKRNLEQRKREVEVLNSIIDDCVKLEWLSEKIDYGLPAHDRKLIKTTGLGDTTADPWDTFVDFCKKYNLVYAIFIGLIGIIWLVLTDTDTGSAICKLFPYLEGYCSAT